jgi:hypothetical protein
VVQVGGNTFRDINEVDRGIMHAAAKKTMIIFPFAVDGIRMATRERRAEVMRIGGSFRIGDRLSLVALDEFLFTEMFMEMTDGTVEAV